MNIEQIGDEFVPVEHDHQEEKEVCCICGRVINGYGNNPAPFKRSGNCCSKCEKAYVIPSRILQHQLFVQRLSSKLVEEKLDKFRKQHRVLTFEELSDKERCELGQICVSGIENDEIVYASYKSFCNDDGIPLEHLTFEEVITCISDYLATVGKTIREWVEEMAEKDLVWLRYNQILASRNQLIPSVFKDEDSMKNTIKIAGVNSVKFLLDRMDAESIAESAAVN